MCVAGDHENSVKNSLRLEHALPRRRIQTRRPGASHLKNTHTHTHRFIQLMSQAVNLPAYPPLACLPSDDTRVLPPTSTSAPATATVSTSSRVVCRHPSSLVAFHRAWSARTRRVCVPSRHSREALILCHHHHHHHRTGRRRLSSRRSQADMLMDDDQNQS